MNEFRVLNDKGDIEVKILKPANAVFQTDEFHVDSTVTVYKNAFNIFDLVFENQQLKEKLNYDLQWAFKYDKQVGNWNKLKKWVKTEHREDAIVINLTWKHATGKFLDKMKELEGSDSNE